VAFARQRPASALRLFVRHAPPDDQTDTAFHLALVQRVLAPFGYFFWFFDLATPIRTRAGGDQEYGGLPVSFLSHDSIEIRSLPTLTHCFPRSFTLITRTAPCLRQLPIAALPSTRAIPDRDVFYVPHPFRSIETRSLPTLAHCFPRSFTFYVAHPIRSIRAPALYEGDGQTEKKVTS